MHRLFVPFALCLFAACGTTAAATGNTAADTGVASDTGTVSDTGSTADTGTVADTAVTDTGSKPDAGPTGTDVASGTDAAVADLGPADTGPADTGPKDTGPADTGPADVAASGACTNPADQAVSSTVDVSSKVSSCASSSLGNGAAAKPCIVKNTGFSDGCAQCFADTIDCVSKNCVMNGACLGSDSAACDACRIKNCGTAFTTCSGLPN